MNARRKNKSISAYVLVSINHKLPQSNEQIEVDIFFILQRVHANNIVRSGL